MIPTFSLGDRLRKARVEKHLEQAQLADMLRVDRSTVVRYEADALKRVDSELVEKWARATDVPPHWLRWGTTEAPTPPRNEAGVEAPIEPLPRLVSIQQPADYRPVDAVADLDSKRRRVARVQRAWWIGEGEAA